MRPGDAFETYHYQVYVVQQKQQERQTGKAKKKFTNFRVRIGSHPKSVKYLTKQ